MTKFDTKIDALLDDLDRCFGPSSPAVFEAEKRSLEQWGQIVERIIKPTLARFAEKMVARGRPATVANGDGKVRIELAATPRRKPTVYEFVFADGMVAIDKVGIGRIATYPPASFTNHACAMAAQAMLIHLIQNGGK